jgi:hypothetical protein
MGRVGRGHLRDDHRLVHGASRGATGVVAGSMAER